LKLVSGNIGRAMIKVSAVKPEHRAVEAPARVFDAQEDVMTAFKAGELARDVIVVVRFQGPRANGMPELHKLTPALASLQDKGFKVALVTDGRMSGASGNVPAAIHITPECVGGGPLGKVRDGDIIRLDSNAGILEARVPAEEWARREIATADLTRNNAGTGRELFTIFRMHAAGAEQGGGLLL
jgi:phosphogluconate dehydratase